MNREGLGPGAQGSVPPFLASPLLAAVLLLWGVGAALVAPEIPRATAALTILMFAATLWHPSLALASLAALTPAGLLSPRPGTSGGAAGVDVRRGLSPAVRRPLGRGLAIPAVLYGRVRAASRGSA